MNDIKKILVIRFRQMGDAILATALCSSLKKTFPNAEIHFVLNKGIATLYENHPDIDKIIAFDSKDHKHFFSYIRKVWNTVRNDKYDVIIDMRSTMNTLLFSLFSLHTPYRIGIKKKYTRLILNHYPPVCDSDLGINMLAHDLSLAKPLEAIKPIEYVEDFRLYPTKEESAQFRNYMERQGINFERPVFLIGVTTKLLHKKWESEYMLAVLKQLLNDYPDIQMIFNYAPGYEEEDARFFYKRLDENTNIKIDIQAKSMRELLALCSNCDFYFGNEGGTRHLAQALKVPSFAIFSPVASKYIWMPKNSVPAEGIDINDILTEDEKRLMTNEEQFAKITPELVYPRLITMIDKVLSGTNFEKI